MVQMEREHARTKIRRTRAETMERKSPLQHLLRIPPDAADKFAVLALESIAANTTYSDEQREMANKNASECRLIRSKVRASLWKRAVCILAGCVLFLYLSRQIATTDGAKATMFVSGIQLLIISAASLLDSVHSSEDIPPLEEYGPNWADLWMEWFWARRQGFCDKRTSERTAWRVREIERFVKEYY
jgi:hypothetical protein